jgi:seryl-tRNA synthetase
VSTAEQPWAALRQRLIDAAVLAELGEPGMFALGGKFNQVFDALDDLYVHTFADLDAESWRFPPVEPKSLFEKTDYVASFPQLTGSLSVFTGDNREHAELLRVRAAGEPWEELLHPGGLMMSPAACHPLYALLTGTLPEAGRTFDVLGSCFRHEPSPDPMRMQTFRMHEFVHAGTAESAQAHRDSTAPRLVAMLESLGLEIEYVPANDPFFGRTGRIMAANQREAALKFELTTKVYQDQAGATAIGSANYHNDHFGTAFGINSADGQVAHTACLGLGMERTVLALFARHGMNISDWPQSVRSVLWKANEH